MNRRSAIALMALLPFVAAREALAEAVPRIPSSAMPGREREQLLGRPTPPPPFIEWQNPLPKPAKRKPKRRRR